MSATPIPVLHVLGSLERGGVETWLLDLLDKLDWSRWQFDFCTLGSSCGRYAELARGRGSRVLACPLGERRGLRPTGRFLLQLDRLLRARRYAIVHSHVHYFSGIVLSAARAAGVPVRVAHSHNSHDGRPDTWPRKLYRAVSARLLSAASSIRLGCSADAAQALFGQTSGSIGAQGSRRRAPVKILHYGVGDAFRLDSSPPALAGSELRIRLGLDPISKVIGHVGRLERQKNHEFLLEIAAAVRQYDPAVQWLLAGDGPHRPEIEQRAKRMGLDGIIRFCGRREDVHELMARAMDAFILPSLHEGLPLALLEAQAAGLRSLVSSRITREAAVVEGAVEFLDLEAGSEVWARQVLTLLSRGRVPLISARSQIEAAGFTAQESLGRLLAAYRAALASSPAGGVS